jgi:ABC-type sugar transport system substrate-binding protein
MQTKWLALFLHDSVNNYQLLLRDDAENSACRHRHKLVVYSAEKNADIQFRQISAVLAECKGNPPAAILVSPVLESSLIGAMAQAAVQRIPWAYLCRWSDTVHAVRRDHPGYSVFSVAADHAQIGRLQGDMLLRLISEKHELVYIQGPQGTSSASRRDGALRRQLASLPKLHWVRYNSDWSIEGGSAAMRGWLGHFKRGNLPLFAICAQNDDMAWGARMALVEGGYLSRNDNPIIIGCDGLATFGQRMVAEGMLTGTVVVPPVSGRAIDELFRALTMRVTVPAEVSIDVLAYPPLERLAKGVSVYEKLICRSHGASPSTRAALPNSSAPKTPSPVAWTTRNGSRAIGGSKDKAPVVLSTRTVPPALEAAVPRTIAKANSAKPGAANTEANRLFAVALKEVADSSRHAAAARSEAMAAVAPAQPAQTGTGGPAKGRTGSRD